MFGHCPPCCCYHNPVTAVSLPTLPLPFCPSSSSPLPPLTPRSSNSLAAVAARLNCDVVEDAAGSGVTHVVHPAVGAAGVAESTVLMSRALPRAR